MAARPHVRALASLVAALVAAGVPFHAPFAAADEAPKVAVAPFHVINKGVDESLGVRVADVIADELRGQDGILLAAPPPPASPAASGGEAAVPEAARAALAQMEKGEGLVRRLKLRTAVDTLTAGIQDYESFPAAVDVKKLREAYIQLAVAHSRLGENDAAGEALQSAVRIGPDAKLAGNYPPVFKKQFNDARREVLGGTRGTASITGDGQVELDGRKLGAAPTKAEGITAGAHFLRVTRPDGSVWGLKLMVSEGEATAAIPAGGTAVASKGPTLTPDSAGLASLESNQLDGKVLSAAAKLGKDVGADYVLVGGLYKSGDGVGCAAHLINLRTRAAVALAPVHFDADLVSAGIETNKLAAEVAKKVQAFPRPGEPIPSPVAAELSKSAVAAVEPEKKPEPVKQPDEEKKPVVVKAPDEEKKPVATNEKHEAEPDLTIVHPKDQSAGGLDETASTSPSTGSSSNAWIWGVAGAAVLLGGAVGGYALYKNSQQPVTGTASLNFQ